jgi:hypothetical protein
MLHPGPTFPIVVECSFSLGGCTIQEVKASPDNLNAVVKSDKGKASVAVPLLNQVEYFQVSALANDPDKLPASPEVSVRGKGVVGENGPKKSSPLESIGMLVVVAFASLLAVTVNFVSNVFKRWMAVNLIKLTERSNNDGRITSPGSNETDSR